MAKDKSFASKVASRDVTKTANTNRGKKVMLLQFAQIRRCSNPTCNRLFGKKQLVVEADDKYYCSYSCSTKAFSDTQTKT